MAHSFTLFETALGHCGLAWSAQGITRVQLPERSQRETRARIVRSLAAEFVREPPAHIAHAIAQIQALLAGETAELGALELDWRGVAPFYRRVYEAARQVPPGATCTYGELARRIGSPGSARAVGQALGKNPFAIVVPCHRVLAAGGKSGGFSANGGVTTKLRMLAIEGALRAEDSTSGLAEPLPLFAGRDALAFDADRACATLAQKDARLARLMRAVGPFKLELNAAHSLFLALAESIVYQQLNAKAAASIFGRLCALFPGASGSLTPERLMRASDEALRGAGLSRAKLAALRDLAQQSLDSKLPTLAQVQAMSDEDIVQALIPVRGIGRWTVEMLLIFRLGRPDVMPLDDYGVRKGFQRAFRAPEDDLRAQLARRSERWRPYRTVAAWYLWRALELPAEQKL